MQLTKILARITLSQDSEGLTVTRLETTLQFQPPQYEASVQPASGLETTSAPVEISVVVPTYKAEGCLRALHERLSATLVAMGKTYELIFIEDCGPDNSWSVLKSLADSDERVTAYKLSKNFGQQMAITAGLSRAEGNWIVVMDCDLQDPPELIEKLYAHAKLGHDIVFAKRKQRTHSPFRRFVSRTYFAIVNSFSQTHAGGDYGAFTLISREVRDAYLRFSDVNRHYLMILFWLGFETSDVEYEQEERYAGESSYSLFSLLKLATEGVFFQTTILLKLIVLLGFLVSIAGVCIAVWAAAEYFLQGALPGWTSLTVLILLLGGVTLTSHGIVGLYVGEIFDQVKQRPLFVIARAHGAKSRREGSAS